ncbi:MAG: hypothetical protein ABI604_17060 [Nitrospirota bacterium]
MELETAVHYVGFFIDHSQEQVGVARSGCADEQVPLRQDLLQEGAMSLCGIDKVDRPTYPNCKFFDQLDSNLWVERRGRSTTRSRSLSMRLWSVASEPKMIVTAIDGW